MNLSEKWTRFREFLTDVRKETGKVSWPAKDEIVGTTTVVLVYTTIVGCFLFLIDAIVTPLVNKLFAAFGG